MGKRNPPPRSKRSRPSRRRSKRTATSLPSIGVSGMRLLRNFNFYPKQLDTSGKPSSNWLDNLKAYGTIALKLFLAAVAYEEKRGATMAPHAAIQCLAIGPEDLLWSSAIKEIRRLEVFDKTGRTVYLSAPAVDYRQARLRAISVRVTPCSNMSERGGRICVAIVPLTMTEAEKIVEKKLPLQQLDFTLLMQMPGAIIAPASRTITKTWRPSPRDFGHEFRECGTSVTPTYDNQAPSLGLPVCMVYFGYQDMSGTKPSSTELYSPEEASFSFDVTGNVDLREYGTSYIRKYPIALYNTETVGVIHPDNLNPVEYPIQQITCEDGSIVLVEPINRQLKHAFGHTGGMDNDFEVIDRMSQATLDSPGNSLG